MSEYHRLFVKGGTYFFTVVTYDRRPLLCEEPALIRLKAAFRYVMDKHPYHMDGLVIELNRFALTRPHKIVSTNQSSD